MVVEAQYFILIINMTKKILEVSVTTEIVTPHVHQPGLFRTNSLRDRIRQARILGVSLDIIPTPSAFDEDGEFFSVDPDADVRCSRLDRADILVTTASKLESQKAAAGVQVGSPTELAASSASLTPDVGAAPLPAPQPTES